MSSIVTSAGSAPAADPVAGPKLIERLKTLHTVTHLRGRLHITLRDLRSALAYTLAGQRDCDEIHELYSRGGPEARREILSGFYFNAWSGGLGGSDDRLLRLLAEGLANKAIAQRLDISEHTVKFHVNAILRKLDAQSRTEAVIEATRRGLILL